MRSPLIRPWIDDYDDNHPHSDAGFAEDKRKLPRLKEHRQPYRPSSMPPSPDQRGLASLGRYLQSGRLFAVCRALTAWLLAWRILPWIVQAAFRILPGPPPPFARHGHVLIAGSLIRNKIEIILATVLATGIVLLTEKGLLTMGRLIERSNLPRTSRAWRLYPLGFLIGALAMAALIGAMAITGYAHIIHQTAPASHVLTTFVEFSIAFILVGFAEELQNRGYILRALSEGIGFWAAAAVTSFWFAATHVFEGDPWFGALGTGLRGFFDCLTWRATGSLAFAIGFHAAWDGTETALFGVPDGSFTVPAALVTTRLSGPVWLSGGTVGPEGSVYAYAVTFMLIMTALLILARRRRSVSS